MDLPAAARLLAVSREIHRHFGRDGVRGRVRRILHDHLIIS
jgi:hypothetical protein